SSRRRCRDAGVQAPRWITILR
ncbi:rhs element Vgr family protein, partial [Escherichia coli 3.4870]